MHCGKLLWIYILSSVYCVVLTLDFRIKTKPYSRFKLRHRTRVWGKPGEPYKGKPYQFEAVSPNIYRNKYRADIR